MKNHPLNAPVLLITFKRLGGLRPVFESLRKVRPRKLYISSNEGRDAAEQEMVRAVRRFLEDSVDWDCEVSKLYREESLGAKQSISGAIDWFFANEERGIILEDDVLADTSFFYYCEELLERYADDPRVGQICGCPKQVSRLRRDTSYIFTRYGPIWGWASWRRAWAFFDLDMKDWPEVRDSGRLRAVCQSDAEYEKRVALYDSLCPASDSYDPNYSTWDYQWGYAKMINGLLCAVPAQNLIENVGVADGLGANVTSGTFPLDRLSLDFPLVHPDRVETDAAFDSLYSRHFTGTALDVRIRRRLRYYFRRCTALLARR